MNQAATWDKIICKASHSTNLWTQFSDHLRSSINHSKNHLKHSYHVQIKVGDRYVRGRGLYDTGNHLYDPVEHRPVSIIEKHLFDELFGEEETATMQMIPYRSLGVSYGLMRGFTADELFIGRGIWRITCSRPVLAVANAEFEAYTGCQIILHPDLL